METSTATLDRVPIQALIGDRYPKSTLYTMLREMGIKPTRVGQVSYITPEQEQLLGQYDLAKANGKEALETFLSGMSGNVLERSQTFEIQPISPLEQTSISQGAWMVLDAIASRLQQVKPEPLSLQRQLEEAAVNGWQLSTAQLREILGVSPVEGDRYGFRLVKAGRMGRQMGWKIEKLLELKPQNL